MSDTTYNMRHGGPYDRGEADAYYGRKFNPHYFEGDTYKSKEILITDKDSAEYKAYEAGYKECVDFKDWG